MLCEDIDSVSFCVVIFFPNLISYQLGVTGFTFIFRNRPLWISPCCSFAMLLSKGNTTLPKLVSIIGAVAVILNGTLVILVDSWRALVQKIS